MIRKLNWLTEEGRRALNKELRKRDNKARHVAGSDNAPSDLTVGKVLGLKRDLKVWIQIDKPYKYPAQYMLCEYTFLPRESDPLSCNNPRQ